MAEEKGWAPDGSLTGRLQDDSRLECRICWYLFDPAEGDELGQVEPGTPFSTLPDDWRCPQCDADKSSFLIVDD